MTAPFLSWVPLAGYVAVLSAISFVTTYFAPETRGRDLDDLRDAGQEAGLLTGPPSFSA